MTTTAAPTNGTIEIAIFKNGVKIKSAICTPKTSQKTWDKMVDVAGGKWNGKDEFTVKIV